jgi:branched-chain amino acid transport system substrate-binding protein
MVENEHVVAIVSHDDVAESSGGDYLEQNNIPVIGGTGTDVTTWAARPNYFQLQTSIPATLLLQASVAEAIDAQKFGTIVCAEVSACLQAQALFQPAAEQYGIEWTGIVTADASAPNYTAPCLSMLQEDTDFISLAIVANVAQRLIPDCLQQGFEGTFGINAQAFVQQAVEDIDGAHFAGNLQAFPWWVDAVPVQEFRDAMEQYQPDVDYRSGDATVIWATLELFRKAVGTPTEDLTPASVLAAYYTISDETLDGLLPQPMTFTAGQPQPKVSCGWLWSYEPGDENPEHLELGDSGNGASDNLATTCASS